MKNNSTAIIIERINIAKKKIIHLIGSISNVKWSSIDEYSLKYSVTIPIVIATVNSA